MNTEIFKSRLLTGLAAAGMLALSGGILVGCDNDDDLGDALDNAGDNIEEGIDEAGDNIEDGVDDIKDEMD